MGIVGNVKKSSFPNVYSKSVTTTDNDLDLCLIKPNTLSEYALAVLDFDHSLDIKTQIYKAHNLIKQQFAATWLVQEVGTYIIFVCDEIPDLSTKQLDADTSILTNIFFEIRTELHSFSV